MKRKKQKKAVTLVEIMIVILLIGLIGGALAVNMRGSMDKGREFKTEQNILRVQDALMMEFAKGERTLQEVIEDKENIMNNCPFVKGGEALLIDAWGNPLEFEVVDNGYDLIVTSPHLASQNANNESR